MMSNGARTSQLIPRAFLIHRGLSSSSHTHTNTNKTSICSATLHSRSVGSVGGLSNVARSRRTLAVQKLGTTGIEDIHLS